MKVLVTGGAGYIGSHTTLCLLENGHDVVVFDNLVNSSSESLQRVEELSGRKVDFRRGDLLNPHAIDLVFAECGIDAVIHFAGLKAVGESVENPLKYYRNNVIGTRPGRVSFNARTRPTATIWCFYRSGRHS